MKERCEKCHCCPDCCHCDPSEFEEVEPWMDEPPVCEECGE